MDITKTTLNAWLEECATVCPRCGSEVTVKERESDFQVQDDTVYVAYRCSKCQLDWLNAYRLSNPVIMGDAGEDFQEVIDNWNDENCIPGMRWEEP